MEDQPIESSFRDNTTPEDSPQYTGEPAPVSAEPTPVVNTASDKSWMSGLSDELRNNPTIQQTPDVETLGKRLIEANKFAGEMSSYKKQFE